MSREDEIRARLGAVPPGEWTIELHKVCPECGGSGRAIGGECPDCAGDGELQTLFVGRGDHAHGYNIVSFTEPAHQWGDVAALICHGPDDLRHMLEQIADTEDQRDIVIAQLEASQRDVEVLTIHRDRAIAKIRQMAAEHGNPAVVAGLNAALTVLDAAAGDA